jgi:hypothetical protein
MNPAGQLLASTGSWRGVQPGRGQGRIRQDFEIGGVWSENISLNWVKS